jgi:hypothetical protein
MESRTSLFVKVLLISFFAFSFPCSVYSADKSIDAASTVASSSIVGSPPSAENVQTDPKDSQASKPPNDDKSKDGKSDNANSPSMASGLGGDGGSFLNLPTVTNSTFTGSAVMNIPIAVPPGRGGIAPNLTLTYRNIQKNGWLGVGWDLDMGAIQRATKFGVSYPVNLPGTDFVAIFNGSTSELVPRGDWGTNYFGAKIEGQFSKYYYNSSTGGWEVTSKNGTKYYYGSLSQSRQDSAFGVFKWCLDKVQDTNGNYMNVYYAKDNGEIYLDRIEYTGNSNAPVLPWTNYVKFHRDNGSRPDKPDMYVPNFRVQTGYRLKTIEVNANGSLARAYKLNYSTNEVTTIRSVLSTVQQYGSDAVLNNGEITSGTSLTIFSGGYDTIGTGPGLVTPAYDPPALPNIISSGYSYYNRPSDGSVLRTGDFNGDGKTDYMWIPFNGDGRWLIAYGTATGFTIPDYNSPALPNTIGGYYNRHTDSFFNITGDFNGDGKTDYMWIPFNGDGRWLIAYGTATGFTLPDYNSPALPNTISGGYYNRPSNDSVLRVGDFNGDGKTDYMWVPFNGDGRWLIAYGTATGFTIPDYNSPAMPNTLDGYYNRHAASFFNVTGDFNGDGKTDYMWIPDNGDGRWLIAYGTANGFAIPNSMSLT